MKTLKVSELTQEQHEEDVEVALLSPEEQRVLEALDDVAESTLAFWKATRHIMGFDPAREFIDAVVALRATREKQRP